MIKMPEPYALPPKIQANNKYIGIKSPFHFIPIVLAIFAMIASNRHWIVGKTEWIGYGTVFFFIYIALFTPEDISITEMFVLMLKDLLLNKKKNFSYQPDQNTLFTPDWTIKSIRKDEK